MEKTTSMAVKVIDGQNLSLRLVTHKTKVLTIIIGSHNSKVVFNVISSPTNPTSLGYYGSFYIIIEWIGK